jgi:hypothetical protein
MTPRQMFDRALVLRSCTLRLYSRYFLPILLGNLYR